METVLAYVNGAVGDGFALALEELSQSRSARDELGQLYVKNDDGTPGAVLNEQSVWVIVDWNWAYDRLPLFVADRVAEYMRKGPCRRCRMPCTDGLLHSMMQQTAKYSYLAARGSWGKLREQYQDCDTRFEWRVEACAGLIVPSPTESLINLLFRD